MIIYSDTTVFNVDAKAIVNTVNCVGFMGAGIALEFKLRYPKMFKDYERKCEEKKIITGKVNYFKNENGSTIINFPTKWHFRHPSKLIWIEQGLQHFVDTYDKNIFSSVAFPKLGAGNGGLNWNEVKSLMEKYLSNLDIDIYICLDNKNYAEGIEKNMLDSFNSISIEELSSLVKLNIKQKDNIKKIRPYDRFWKIAKTESIGMKTYSKIFKYFYLLVMEKNHELKQLTFFDL